MKQTDSSLRIAVVYSTAENCETAKAGYEATHEDTHVSAVEVHDALLRLGHTPFLVPVSITTTDIIGTISAELIFNLIEWTGAEIGAAKKAYEKLDALSIPYTGADWGNYLLVSDKRLMKQAFVDHHIKSPWYTVIEDQTDWDAAGAAYPCIVKPALEHCSIGLSKDVIANDETMLKAIVRRQVEAFRQPVLVEEFIAGRELHVTVVAIDGKPVIFPPAEIFFSTSGTGAFLTYGSRWDTNHPDYHESNIGVAHVDAPLMKQIEAIVVELFTHTGYRDYARLDLRVRDGIVYVLEANCNPGLGDDNESGMTISYTAMGWSFTDLIGAIVASTLARRYG